MAYCQTLYNADFNFSQHITWSVTALNSFATQWSNNELIKLSQCVLWLNYHTSHINPDNKLDYFSQEIKCALWGFSDIPIGSGLRKSILKFGNVIFLK